MDAIYVSSKSSKTSDPQRLLLNVSDKIKSKRSDKRVVLSNLSFYCTWKDIKKNTKIIMSNITSDIE